EGRSAGSSHRERVLETLRCSALDRSLAVRAHVPPLATSRSKSESQGPLSRAHFPGQICHGVSILSCLAGFAPHHFTHGKRRRITRAASAAILFMSACQNYVARTDDECDLQKHQAVRTVGPGPAR